MDSLIVKMNMETDTSYWDWKGKNPDVDALPLMRGPVPVALIMIAYLALVAFGPRLMKNRPPMLLSNIMIFYNAIQILSSGLLTLLIVLDGNFNDGFLHAGCKYSVDSRDPGLMYGTYFYFIMKITELLDTLFFILRKKNNQITFLHVYHHATMVLYMWSYTKYGMAGEGAVLAFLNCFVHVVMYTYYLFAGLGPRFQQYLWWKKYVTELQMVQFTLMLIYLSWTFFSPRCQFHPSFTIFIFTNVSIYYALFLQFYFRSYKKNKKEKL